MKNDVRMRLFSVPLSPHVYKWLKNYRAYRDSPIQVNEDILTSKKVKGSTIYNHFNSNLPTVKAYIRDADKHKAYYLYRHLSACFDNDLITYATLNSSLGIPIMPAIEDFLNKCRITEADLKLETAYKRWQRSESGKLPGIKIYTHED